MVKYGFLVLIEGQRTSVVKNHFLNFPKFGKQQVSEFQNEFQFKNVYRSYCPFRSCPGRDYLIYKCILL